MLARYRRRFQEGVRHVRFARSMQLNSGKRRSLEFSLALFGTEEGEHCLTVVRDLTARKQAEEALMRSELHFRSIWEQSSEGMRLTNEEGLILDVNEAFCRLAGVARGDLVGKPLTVLYPDREDHREILRKYARRFEEGSMHGRFENVMQTPDGQALEVEVSYTVLADSPGQRNLLCIFRDLTPRREAERQRLELERKVLEAQRLESLGGLAGGIAHDFNNLLTAILGNATMAAAVLPENSPAQRLLANAEKTCLQAADLCKQMLAYAGRGKIVVQPVVLGDLLAGMDHLLRISIARHVTLLLDSPAGLPVVGAEVSQLQQVLVNLVINASEAIGDDAGVIRVATSSRFLDHTWLAKARAAPEAEPGQYVLIEVSDSGPGMRPETLARVFDPFFTTKFTGRGLGLASVLGIVRRHSGAIQVTSEPGRGTTFCVALPAAKGEVQPEPRREQRREVCPSRGLVLVVDDEDQVRNVSHVMLQHAGYDVLTAVNGEDGLRCFRERQHEIRAVLLDLTMPVMDGTTALRHIRQWSSDMPVLLMSGYSESEELAAQRREPATDFLPKPFSHERLVEKLAVLLDRKQAGVV
jgi:two-component system, cell cycle sensor histidine kinase and response regulator CckA